MTRTIVRLLMVVGLIGIGWTAGRAQAPQAPPQSDFELIVSGPVGEAQITCVRGCAITWAPTVIPAAGPVEIKVPTPTLRGAVNAAAAQGCVAPGYSPTNCKIWGWLRK